MFRKDIFIKLKRKGVIFKKKHIIDGIKKAGNLVLKTLDFVEKTIKPGITTNFINEVVHNFTVKNGAIPAPLNYHGYPKSVCVSVNEIVCHGIPNNRILLDGDIVNIDVTTLLDGYYADANKSFFVGRPGDKAKQIINVARNCLLVGISMVKPGNTTRDIGIAIQEHAETMGFSVVREFVGHGTGLSFHEFPQIPHYELFGENILLLPNMVFTIEPMINFGSKEVKILSNGWTAITCDGSLSAQFEQTICVTSSGSESLTPYKL